MGGGLRQAFGYRAWLRAGVSNIDGYLSPNQDTLLYLIHLSFPLQHSTLPLILRFVCGLPFLHCICQLLLCAPWFGVRDSQLGLTAWWLCGLHNGEPTDGRRPSPADPYVLHCCFDVCAYELFAVI
jgi:hypothetical protein